MQCNADTFVRRVSASAQAYANIDGHTIARLVTLVSSYTLCLQLHEACTDLPIPQRSISKTKHNLVTFIGLQLDQQYVFRYLAWILCPAYKVRHHKIQ